MDVIEKITSLEKPSAANLKQRIVEIYGEIGGQLGYSVLFEERGVCLMWKKEEEEIAFEVQFGNRGEFFGSVKRLFSSGAGMCVFVTSSASHSYSLSELEGMLHREFRGHGKTVVLYDIETQRHLVLSQIKEQNWGQKRKPAERRKKIIGRKGEHKVQD
ncbi:hypothetical protein COV61_04020 [Candidatus Micrarchaeota archaeon CG11_big_fil_rev_8_21_14_0_20_47_5]|nr:MAG: hypothetical protein AUJ17_01795 [Candidatus Micrarchaeota archaeon CG1_02_47_40]PIN83123.1 MAG: hypothetical protein COV61_04020 [Candidatus Micrarchaeota archaeon CG11_big_fil_rev_8_21_14_0_20_47_5]